MSETENENQTTDEQAPELPVPETLNSTMLITVHPGQLAASVRDRVDVVIAIGSANEVLGPFGQSSDIDTAPGEAVFWSRKDGGPHKIRTLPGQLEQGRKEAIERRYTAPA